MVMTRSRQINKYYSPRVMRRSSEGYKAMRVFTPKSEKESEPGDTDDKGESELFVEPSKLIVSSPDWSSELLENLQATVKMSPHISTELTWSSEGERLCGLILLRTSRPALSPLWSAPSM